jgi:hypothetical protein
VTALLGVYTSEPSAAGVTVPWLGFVVTVSGFWSRRRPAAIEPEAGSLLRMPGAATVYVVAPAGIM